MSSNSRLALTPQMETILTEAFYRFHFLTLEQVTRLLYSPKSKNFVGRLLQKLTESNYLDRFPLPTGYRLQPYIYLLGRKGKQYLTHDLGWTVPKLPALSVMQTRSNSFLTHLLEVNTILITAKLLERTTSARLLHFTHDIELKKHPFLLPQAAGKKKPIIPDAILDIQGSNRRVLWLELERGTNNESDIQSKMHDICDVFDRRLFQERVGTNQCRVCYVSTNGEDDTQRLRRIARTVLTERLGEAAFHSKRSLLFAFLTCPQLGEEPLDPTTLFLSPVWHSVYTSPSFPIIE